MTRTVPVVVTHLEMRTPPMAQADDDPPGVRLVHVTPPEAATAAARLYRAVGGAWHWRDRLSWTPSEWAAAVHAPGVELWVAQRGDVELGYAELAPSGTAMEIRYFGLVPGAIGQGLGRWLLHRSISLAWASAPQRVILNTCTLDGPAALPNYLARGFTIVREEHQLRELPT
jgi:GNAT superfamily N-acetyltransferase